MIFYEGEKVTWSGGEGFVAEGHIVALGTTSAHVKWTSGPEVDSITLTSLYDIEPVTAVKSDEDDPMHFTAVRRAYDTEQEVGVLNFLASNNYLTGWQKIAQDVISYTKARIAADASMELVDEQLSTPERARVIEASALALLRDAFTESE